MGYSCGPCGNSSACSGGGYSSLEKIAYSAPRTYNSSSTGYSGKISYLAEAVAVELPSMVKEVFDNPVLYDNKHDTNPYSKPLTVSYTPVASPFILPHKPVFVGCYLPI